MPGRRVKDWEDSDWVKVATYLAVGVAIVLIIIKLFAWIATDAISLQATLFDSVLDAAASIVNLVAVREALRPADHEHRFGHGKIEALAALAQSTFIAGSAVFLMIEALRRFYITEVIKQTRIGIIVMILSIGITVGLVLFQRYVIHKTHSTAIKADATHYKADVLVNSGVIIALMGAEWFRWYVLDTVIGLMIAGYILYTAWGIAQEAFHILIDRELPDAQREHICTIVLSHPQVKGIHDLRTRRAGQHSFIQLHLELDGNISLSAAHAISDEVATSIMQAYPQAEVIIHQDPYQLTGARLFDL